MKNLILSFTLVLASTSVLASDAITTKNFVRAETDMQMKAYVNNFNTFGRLHLNRAMYDVTKQLTIRPNTDTLYSFGIFDLTNKLEINMPKTDRYQSAMIVNQDHSLYALYKGNHVLTKESIRSRYVFIILRTFADPHDKADLKIAHGLQDKVIITQKEKGSFNVPDWDKKSLEKKRKELVEIASLLPNSQGMFGIKEKLNPVIHLLGAAYGWGGLPEADASYDIASPKENNGKIVHTLTVNNVPVDGFWSVTVYNKDGYFDINDRAVYSLNSQTVKRNKDNSATIQFGECNGVDNCLDIMEGWNYAIRMYRPKQSILNGTWHFPKPMPK